MLCNNFLLLVFRAHLPLEESGGIHYDIKRQTHEVLHSARNTELRHHVYRNEVFGKTKAMVPTNRVCSIDNVCVSDLKVLQTVTTLGMHLRMISISLKVTDQRYRAMQFFTEDLHYVYQKLSKITVNMYISMYNFIENL